MATVSESTAIEAPLERVWDLYFDSDNWPAWVDQFAAIVRWVSYPDAGSELVWRSNKAGRGEVTERVIEHEPLRRHLIEFSDPESEGTLLTTFTDAGGATRVDLEMEYRLRTGGLFARMGDILFVRSQMQASLSRSLEGLRAEAEAQPH